MQIVKKSFLLLSVLVGIVCILYPLSLWIVGQVFFPFQANGSIINDTSGKPIGSKLIAQQFTKDEYFHPRPSAANYDASASSSSALAASNYALRDRIARSLGLVATYKDGKPVAPDVEKWFQQDQFNGQKNIVAQWAQLHSSLAQAWVVSDSVHTAYVQDWAKQNPQQAKGLSDVDLAVAFFKDYSAKNPGKFLVLQDNKIQNVNSGSDIQAIFFDMWCQDHPDVVLQDVPGDYVTTSASGLDPHISLQNANFQLSRVATAWATRLKKDPQVVSSAIKEILAQKAQMPLAGLVGEHFVNVLEVNIALQNTFAEQ